MDAFRRWRLLRIIITSLFLMLVWFLFSASLAPLSLLAGLFGSILIGSVSYDVFIEKHEAARRSLLPHLLPALVYPFRLVFAMYAASFKLLPAILNGKVSPHIVHFRSRVHTELARVVLAHSITFTPGTITLDLDDDHFIVHWMFADTRHSVRAGKEIKGDLEESIRKIWI
ncbi:Na+/H+ antiporter subunit E [Treponema sp.]